MLISERIYDLMKEKEMSQKDFSEMTGISQSTISDWKRKKTNPSADKIMIICEVLGVTPYELLTGTENDKFKEYKETDYVVINKNSKEYYLVEAYRGFDYEMRSRLEGYIQAMKDLQ
ncbi:MAG: helix-turn-helix transcriptional regulator [Agathobacter sp.]|nr:helix-turn-helix transcriptional regulator [Agathobacter sp.]MEE1100020.1 helix-turn-helix transcriptional regulator [Agathobacter sp.]